MDAKVKASIDIGDNLTKLLQQLANQIGTTVDKIFPWYVKQSVIENSVYLSLWIIGLFVTIIVLTISWRKLTFDSDNTPNKWIVGVVIGIVLLCIIVISSFQLPNIISGIFNPEYEAMEALLHHVKLLR